MGFATVPGAQWDPILNHPKISAPLWNPVAIPRALSSSWILPFSRRTFPTDPWELQSSAQKPNDAFLAFPSASQRRRTNGKFWNLNSPGTRIPARRKRARKSPPQQHKILGLFRLENTFGIICSDPCPIPTSAPRATSRNSLDTSRDEDSQPPWALPRPERLFHEEIPAEAVPPFPVIPWDRIPTPPPRQGIVESHELPLEPPSLQEPQEEADARFSRYPRGNSKGRISGFVPINNTEFSGSALTPERINPEPKPCLGSCCAFPRAFPDLTASTRISIGDSQFFFPSTAKSWNVLGKDLDFPPPPCAAQHRDGIQRVPGSFPLENSSSQMFSHQGQDSGEAFRALFLHLGILSRGSGCSRAVQHPLDLWDRHLRNSPCRHNPTSRGHPGSTRSPWIFPGSPRCPSVLSLHPGMLRLLRHGPNPTDPGGLAFQVPAFQVLPFQQDHLTHSGQNSQDFRGESKTLPEHIPAASSRSSRISTGIAGFGIPRARITGNVPGG